MKPAEDQSRRVTYTDRCRLGQLLNDQDCRPWGTPHCRGKLEFILEEAEPVEAHKAPENLVTMNSMVRLSELPSEKRRTVTLAYPEEVDLASDGISVLEPLGTALLGRKVGDVIQCSPPEMSQQRFRIAEVTYQPEHAGAFHL